jgi:hypothetical protein
MPLAARFVEHVRACFTGLWIVSHEHPDALTEIARVCRDEDWQLATWNLADGLRSEGTRVEAGDPLAAVRAMDALAVPGGTSILVLENFHRFLQSAEVVQALAGQVVAGKANRTFVVILAPVVSLPIELEKLFVVLEHDLPDREQLLAVAQGVATEPGELPTGPDLDRVLDAAAGLTRYEAEGAFSLSLVRHGTVRPDAVWDLKTQTLHKSGLLTLHRGGEDFAALGGLSALKAFCRRALRRSSRGNPLRRAKGCLLLSPPGCGKSAFAKALGAETGRPVLILDVGTLMGSLVGQTEERTRQALRIVEAMAPCVAMIDEADKAFAGVGNSSDSGVTARMFGTFLTWLADHESDVFVVCTANDVARLPPEFSRAERFDGVFFLDLPGRAEKDAIWRLYRTRFELPEQPQPADESWTGAEIRACCRLAALLDLPLVEASRNVVPVAVTNAEAVERLRTWADGRCLDADRPGLYRRVAQRSTRRRVTRDASRI